MAAEREEFLFGELARASKELLCIHPDPDAEARRVKSRVNALVEDAEPGSPSFCSERTKAFILASLQDRVNQVDVFVESCRAALALVYSAMFPLNEQPQGIGALMRKFRQGERIRAFV